MGTSSGFESLSLQRIQINPALQPRSPLTTRTHVCQDFSDLSGAQFNFLELTAWSFSET